MAKVHSPKVKGSVCDIPISEIDNNYNSFLRPENSNGVIIIQTEKKGRVQLGICFLTSFSSVSIVHYEQAW